MAGDRLGYNRAPIRVLNDTWNI